MDPRRPSPAEVEREFRDFPRRRLRVPLKRRSPVVPPAFPANSPRRRGEVSDRYRAGGGYRILRKPFLLDEE